MSSESLQFVVLIGFAHQTVMVRAIRQARARQTHSWIPSSTCMDASWVRFP